MFVRIIGVTLAMISAACTASWFWDLGLTLNLGMACFGLAAGLGLEGAKFGLKPTSIHNFIGVGLVTVASMAASYYYLESAFQKLQPSTITITGLAGQLENLDLQIAEIQKQQRGFSDREYLTKATELTPVLENMYQARQALVLELGTIDQARQPALLEQYSFLVFGLVAFLIDFMAFLCLAEARKPVLGQKPTTPPVTMRPAAKSKHRASTEQAPSSTEIVPDTVPAPVPAVPATDQKPIWNRSVVMQEICRHELEPTTAAIRRKYGGRAERAKEVLDDLASSGKLAPTGNPRAPWKVVDTKVTPLRRS